jgi:hypothetical protein
MLCLLEVCDNVMGEMILQDQCGIRLVPIHG